MRAAISNLEEMDVDYKIAILGDMFELGKYSDEEHSNLINELENSTIDKVYLIGKEFAKSNTSSLKHFETTAEFIQENIISTISSATILIKGSRGMALEKIVE